MNDRLLWLPEHDVEVKFMECSKFPVWKEISSNAEKGLLTIAV